MYYLILLRFITTITCVSFDYRDLSNTEFTDDYRHSTWSEGKRFSMGSCDRGIQDTPS